TRLLESARAGHLPCVWATADGRSGVTEDEGGPPLGVQSGAVYPVTRYRLDSGGVFVMATDGGGPVDASGRGDEQVSRLAGIAAVARMDVDALAAAVIRGGRGGHDDDAAVLVIGHDKPAGQP
ncbi:PP2C family protein-serine/threonine phosphatase, partial [Streptomyces thermocarboxydus]